MLNDVCIYSIDKDLLNGFFAITFFILMHKACQSCEAKVRPVSSNLFLGIIFLKLLFQEKM